MVKYNMVALCQANISHFCISVMGKVGIVTVCQGMRVHCVSVHYVTISHVNMVVHVYIQTQDTCVYVHMADVVSIAVKVG